MKKNNNKNLFYFLIFLAFFCVCVLIYIVFAYLKNYFPFSRVLFINENFSSYYDALNNIPSNFRLASKKEIQNELVKKKKFTCLPGFVSDQLDAVNAVGIKNDICGSICNSVMQPIKVDYAGAYCVGFVYPFSQSVSEFTTASNTSVFKCRNFDKRENILSFRSIGKKLKTENEAVEKCMENDECAGIVENVRGDFFLAEYVQLSKDYKNLSFKAKRQEFFNI